LKYVPIPIAMLEVGKPLPVDILSASGQLLLRKGQPIVSEQHRDKLHGFNASATPADAMAWQRAYERTVHTLIRDGVDVQEIARIRMPSEIRESDFVVGQQLNGGWLDLQEVLRGILYQGGLAINPLQRLLGIEKKALSLLQADADDSLFCLLQALADDSLGYCATHALLCAVICYLTAEKLKLDTLQKHALFSAALTMNIGMAREQDSMSRQSGALTDWQRKLVAEHPQKSVEILQSFGVDDADQLDIVRWHHDALSAEGIARNLPSRRLLSLADGFVARMAARKTRSALSAVKAVRSMVLGAEGETIGVGSAVAQAVGFYPPGSYVLLPNGETAVVVKRGARANTPWVVSILDKDAMPINRYVCRDTSQPDLVIAEAVNFEKVRVAVSADKARSAREKIPR
jgi:HD-GYP domain-containing protein (c-di-GMP phosphodiesterase class II)